MSASSSLLAISYGNCASTSTDILRNNFRWLIRLSAADCAIICTHTYKKPEWYHRNA